MKQAKHCKPTLAWIFIVNYLCEWKLTCINPGHEILEWKRSMTTKLPSFSTSWRRSFFFKKKKKLQQRDISGGLARNYWQGPLEWLFPPKISKEISQFIGRHRNLRNKHQQPKALSGIASYYNIRRRAGRWSLFSTVMRSSPPEIWNIKYTAAHGGNIIAALDYYTNPRYTSTRRSSQLKSKELAHRNPFSIPKSVKWRCISISIDIFRTCCTRLYGIIYL